MRDVVWPSLKRNLIAILRGITPKEVLAVGEVLAEAGFEMIEVPMNSPNAFDSIESLAHSLPASVIVGGGTVLKPVEVIRLHGVGGRLMVSPNVDPNNIVAGNRLGLITLPGVFTATEALLAVSVGASGLKFFPASALGPAGIKGIRSILPTATVIGAVGGVSHDDFPAYRAAGVSVFGLGTSLYQPGMTAAEVKKRAVLAVAAYDAKMDD